MRTAATPCTSLNNDTAIADDASANPKATSMPRSACGIAASKMRPVRYGVIVPKTPTPIAVPISVRTSERMPRAPKRSMSRARSGPGGNGR